MNKSTETTALIGNRAEAIAALSELLPKVIKRKAAHGELNLPAWRIKKTKHGYECIDQKGEAAWRFGTPEGAEELEGVLGIRGEVPPPVDELIAVLRENLSPENIINEWRAYASIIQQAVDAGDVEALRELEKEDVMDILSHSREANYSLRESLNELVGFPVKTKAA